MHIIGLALNEEFNQLKMKNKTFKFLEKTFNKDYNNLNQSPNYAALEDSENYLIKSLESIVSYKRENLKDKENEDQCKLLAEWLIEYTKHLLRLKFTSPNDPLVDFSEIRQSQINESLINHVDSNESETKSNNVIEQRKAKILKKLNQMQTKFMNTNKDLLEEISTTDLNEQSNSSLVTNDTKDDVDGTMRYTYDHICPLNV